MSLRAEALRFALRRIAKGKHDKQPDIPAIRRNLQTMARLIPKPSDGTRIEPIVAGGVPGLRVAAPRSQDSRHILYLHGGAYAYGTAWLYRDFLRRLSAATGASVLCIDYRLAPEHPFPAALDDAVTAYRWLLANGAKSARMAVIGDSAGGGLTFATLLRLRDEAMPMPAAAVGLSPWTDLTSSGESIQANADADPMLRPAQTRFFATSYLGGADPRHPGASPVFGDPAGLPPSLIQVGSDEILRDDAVAMAERLRGAGVTTELEVWPRMPHVWQLYARFLPEARAAVERIGRFVVEHTEGR